MHQQMVYYAADGRDREMELAAAERDRGCSCSPLGLGRMISRAIKRRNGREGRIRNESNGERLNYAMAYPPAQTCYARPATARAITVTTTAHPGGAPPEPARTAYATMPGGSTHGATAAAPPPGPGGGKPRKKKKKRVRFTPAGAPGGTASAYDGAPPPHAGHAPQHYPEQAASGGATAASAYYSHNGAAEPYGPAPPPAHGQGQGHAYGYGYAPSSSYGRYAPSPLPRWETTPRRHEYFSGEYRWYYPTPVREGIYRVATDANRLTAIFSEENPNACTIV